MRGDRHSTTAEEGQIGLAASRAVSLHHRRLSSDVERRLFKLDTNQPDAPVPIGTECPMRAPAAARIGS
jgi:hypothetical protein